MKASCGPKVLSSSLGPKVAAWIGPETNSQNGSKSWNTALLEPLSRPQPSTAVAKTPRNIGTEHISRPCLSNTVSPCILDMCWTGDGRMARKVNDKVLDTGEARRKMKARGKPYYRMIEPGLHLGYRRLKGQERAGTWLVRHYLGKQAYEVERIGTADDLSDADGVAILDFKQAQDKARERMVNRAHAAAGKTGPLTVAMAMNDYLGFLDSKRKSGRDARWKSEAFIVPVLGRIDVEKLTTEDLEKWLDGIAKAPARIRTKKGEKQQFRKFGEGDEVRALRATANRLWVILKAALNRAFRNKRVPSDATWRRVEKFEETDVARAEYLSVAEGVRLVNACEPALRRLVRVALATGA